MLAVLYRMYRMGVIRLLSTCKSLVLETTAKPSGSPNPNLGVTDKRCVEQ
jgi:hypothetical protein